MKKAALTVITLLFAALAAALLPGARAEAKELLGAGATFPFPYYSKLFDTYNQEKGVKVNYQAIGSGGFRLEGRFVFLKAADAAGLHKSPPRRRHSAIVASAV